MAILYTSDLDRTLIFSKRFIDDSNRQNSVIIEEKEKQGVKVPISYMNVKALNMLSKLQEHKDFLFVPTTTRSLLQYFRISNKLIRSPYAIVANGGYILENKEESNICEPWRQIISKKLDKDKLIFSEILKKLNRLNSYLYKNFESVDSVFFYAVILEDYKDEILKKVFEIVSKYDWIYTLQGYKLYVMPKYINKESAVSFLKEYTNSDVLITSGDGKLDTDFIILGDIAFIPDDSEVLSYLPSGFNFNLIPPGLSGTEVMLNNISNIVNKK